MVRTHIEDNRLEWYLFDDPGHHSGPVSKHTRLPYLVRTRVRWTGIKIGQVRWTVMKIGQVR
jgi:hypothetical protein